MKNEMPAMPATATGVYRVRDERTLNMPCPRDGIDYNQRTLREKEQWLHAASLRTGSGVELLVRRMGNVQRGRYMEARKNAQRRIAGTRDREHNDTIITFTFLDD